MPPSPARLDTGQPPFVGRRTELAALRSALQAAAAGERVLALVGGEPGAGTTRLVAEATRDLPFPVLWSACWAGPDAPPFWPWVQLLRRLAPAPDRHPELRALLDPLPSGSVAATDPSGPGARFRLFDAVAAALAEAALPAPLVIVLDDLHWADEGSVRLLQFLARDTRPAALAVVGTYDDTDLDDATPLRTCLAELVRDGLHLALGGLGPGEVAQLVGARLPAGVDVPAGAVTRLHRLSGGNPLFLRELSALVAPDGSLPTGTGPAEPFATGLVGPGADGAVPAGARAVVARRLERLTPSTVQALRAAAVLGDAPDTALLAAVAGIGKAQLLACVAEAAGAGLLRGPDAAGAVTFPHTLVRAVLHDALDARQRADLHARAAAVLEEQSGDARLLQRAEHLLRGRLVSGAAAADLAERAAERCLASLAYEDAAAWFRRALDALRAEPDDPRREGDLLVRCGQARLAAGDATAARRDFTSAARVAQGAGDARTLARAALGMGSGPGGFEVQLLDPVQVDLLEQALRALGGKPSALRSRVLARLSVASSFLADEDARAALADEAVAVAREVQDAAALAHALACRCDVLAGPQHCERRLTAAAEVTDLGRGIGDRPLELLGRRLRLVALLETGDITAADREIDRFALAAELLGQPLYSWYVPLWRGMRALMRGELAAAERFCALAASEGRRAQSANAEVLTFTQDWVRWRYEGRYVEAGTAVAAALGVMTGGSPVTAGLRAVAAAQAGDDAKARTLLRQWRASGQPERLWDSEWLPETAQLAQAAVAVGDSDLAALLAEQLRPFAHRYCVEGIGAAVTGSVAWYLALLADFLGDGASAAAYAEQARLAHERIGLVGEPPPLVAPRQPEAGPAPAVPAAASTGPPGPPVAPAASLVREGATWALTYAGRTVRLRDVKGLRDLAVLVSRPEREVHCLELMGAAVVTPDAGPAVDAQARRAYERRIRELQSEVDDAQAAGDPARAERAEVELDALVQQLAGAFGLSGRTRATGSSSERARSAVSWRLRATLRQVAREHPELGRHLRNAVRTGTWCCYRPETPVVWAVDAGRRGGG